MTAPETNEPASGKSKSEDQETAGKAKPVRPEPSSTTPILDALASLVDEEETQEDLVVEAVQAAPSSTPVVDALAALVDEEEAQEALAVSQDGSFVAQAPSVATLNARMREYDDTLKHVVRRDHWLKLVRKIAELKAGAHAGERLRVLTLPGPHRFEYGLYLEEGLLETLTAEDGTTLEAAMVGFETDPTTFGLLETTTPRFKRLFHADLIKTLADKEARDHKALLSLFPFDVINLDLTGSLVAPKEGPYGEVLQAITNTLLFQGSQPTPWALMLTFRAGLEGNDPDALERLRRQFQENLDAHAQVKELCESRYATNSAATLLEKRGEEALGQFAAKWIVDQANAHNWKVALARHIYYRREFAPGKTYTIRKLLFALERADHSKYDLPGKRPIVRTWHVENLVSALEGCREFDVNHQVDGLLKNRKDYVEKLRAEVAALIGKYSPLGADAN